MLTALAKHLARCNGCANNTCKLSPCKTSVHVTGVWNHGPTLSWASDSAATDSASCHSCRVSVLPSTRVGQGQIWCTMTDLHYSQVLISSRQVDGPVHVKAEPYFTAQGAPDWLFRMFTGLQHQKPTLERNCEVHIPTQPTCANRGRGR